MTRSRALFHRLGERLRDPAAEAPADKTLLGIHAERLLNDPVLHLAFERVEQGLVNTWKASAGVDVDGRERCHNELRALGRVKGELMRFLGDKKLVEAEHKAKQAEQQRERERREGIA